MRTDVLLAGLFFSLISAAIAEPGPLESDQYRTELDPVVVTGTRTPVPLPQTPASVTSISSDELMLIGARHPSEIFGRAPGAWISRGSGQEHLTAIRSPVLTGAGACGAFLFLEDGIPTRPAGFCNVNGLFEINFEQADSIEVIRGPGSALYGSNAMHGIVNVLSDDPRLKRPDRASIEAGSYDFYRIAADTTLHAGRRAWRMRVNSASDGGFQESSGYNQQKLNIDYADALDAGELRAGAAATHLDQETAGFIFGQDAYRDPGLRRRNFNPDAFREADSQRVWLHWLPLSSGTAQWDTRIYARNSSMLFTQHFLPGEPLEENGQQSIGALFNVGWDGARQNGSLGLDIEYAQGFLVEDQPEPIRNGTPTMIEIRPAGKHYDYTVDTLLAAPYFDWSWQPVTDWRLQAGLRAEFLQYDYDNRMSDGNTRDDGTLCGFGGCLFNRPADRSDAFFNVAPKLGAIREFERHAVRVTLARGFRAPQATELYRLQRGQNVADLRPEELDSVEFGIRGGAHNLSYDVAAFYMEKRDIILRDAEGFIISGGRTRHRGVELEANYEFLPAWSAVFSGTYALHQYAFDRDVAQGETIRSGNDIDTAPRLLANFLLTWHYTAGSHAQMEIAHTGPYFMDAENVHRYPGHTLLNLRFRHRLTTRWALSLRITNALDRAYAERADFAFGEFRYFPGQNRAVTAEISTIF